MKKENIYEYYLLIEDILDNNEFIKLKNCPHHKINRLEHSKRVSYLSYKISKKLKLDYKSVARAGLLHDFFLNNYKEENKLNLLVNHPSKALNNSQKYYNLNDKEINIIESHMFPINIKKYPMYKESIIVSIVDKLVGVYDKLYAYFNYMRYDFKFTIILLSILIRYY